MAIDVARHGSEAAFELQPVRHREPRPNLRQQSFYLVESSYLYTHRRTFDLYRR